MVGEVEAPSDDEVLRRIEYLGHLPIDTEVARVHADIWASLEASGEVIDAHDLWIAATALTHGMELATVNRQHFERVPGLSLVAM